MIHAPLFAGINGFGVAADWMGWEQAFHCEIDPLCQTVLQYYWPNSKPYYDIKQTDFTIWRNRIDILTGGFPCQPYSAAGKRLGTEDNRHLWPEYHRAIREIQPPIVVAENVRGLINWDRGMVFDQVQIDLENEGYEVTPFLLPAASVGAPHERYRVWFVAYSDKYRRKRWAPMGNGQKENSEIGGNIFKQAERHGIQWPTTNAQKTNCKRSGYSWTRGHGITRMGSFENVANAKKQRLQRWGNGRNCQKPENEIKTWGGFTGSVHDSWQNFPTQSPVCGRNDGLPSELDRITVSAKKGTRTLTAKQSWARWRKESIKAYGNAIVPQVAFQIFKVIEQMLFISWKNSGKP